VLFRSLVNSSSLVYVDDRNLRSRLGQFNEEFLVELKQCGIEDSVVAQSLKKFPTSHQPRFLTSLVFEYLDIACGEESCKLAEHIQKRLASAQFGRGYERIIRDECERLTKQLTKQQIGETVKRSLDGLKLVKLCGRRQIKTYLQYDCERLPNSDSSGLKYFCEQNNGGKEWIINVRSDFNGDTEFYSKVATVISKTAVESINSINVSFHLATILDCPIDQIHQVLNRMDIKQLPNNALDSESLRFSRTVLGEFVPQNVQGLLIPNLYLFQSGWLVAMEADDPLDRGEQVAPTFSFVQIIHRVMSDASSSTNVSDTYVVKVSEDGEEMEVQANALYAFRRPEPEEASRVVVLHPLNAELQYNYLVFNESDNFSNIFKDLKREVNEAWNLPEDQRKRVIRRLLLKWHPDKNPNKKDLCTRVFQVLGNLIRMRQDGRRIDDVTEEEAAGSTSERDRPSTDFDDILRQRARNYSQQESYWRENCRSSSRSSSQRDWSSRRRDDFEDIFENFRKAENPQPGEANRWMQQANFDLEAAENDSGTAPEWVCQKCFQVFLMFLNSRSAFVYVENVRHCSLEFAEIFN